MPVLLLALKILAGLLLAVLVLLAAALLLPLGIAVEYRPGRVETRPVYKTYLKQSGGKCQFTNQTFPFLSKGQGAAGRKKAGHGANRARP